MKGRMRGENKNRKGFSKWKPRAWEAGRGWIPAWSASCSHLLPSDCHQSHGVAAPCPGAPDIDEDGSDYFFTHVSIPFPQPLLEEGPGPAQPHNALRPHPSSLGHSQ